MKLDFSSSLDQSMIPESSLICYACISKGTTILAEFSSGDHDLEILALQCLEKTPPFHVWFSHTFRNKIYSFLMEEPFVYFTILDESFGKAHGFHFLERVKDSFMNFLRKKSIKEINNLTSHCFHEELNPVFRSLMILSDEVGALQSPVMSLRDTPNGNLDSRSSGKKVGSIPFLGKAGKHFKKKRSSNEMSGVRDFPIEKNMDASNVVNLSREFSVSLQKNVSYEGYGELQHSQKMWRRHVWTVLLIDLMVCFVLFGVWLFVCRGFECLAS